MLTIDSARYGLTISFLYAEKYLKSLEWFKYFLSKLLFTILFVPASFNFVPTQPLTMEILETSYGTLSVYVNPLISSEENLFHLSFVDKANKTHSIFMKEDDGHWTFADPGSVPGWITGLHQQFNTLISKELLRMQREEV